jgi:hypothetical protein
LILTGQALNSTYNDPADFLNKVQTSVCSNLLFNCKNISIDVKNYSSFGSILITSQINASNNFDGRTLTYCPGNAGSIVVVRLFYQCRCSSPDLATTSQICRATSDCCRRQRCSRTSLSRRPRPPAEMAKR